LAADLTNTVIEVLITQLPPLVNDGLAPDDPMYLKILVRGPLQDDPTRKAFFLTVQGDVEAGFRKPLSSLTEPERARVGPTPSYEIGGDFLMVNWFKLEGWTPRRNRADLNYQLAGEALRRVERAVQSLERRDFFETLATDDGMETTANLVQCFNALDRNFKVIGGETERYGKLWLQFVLFSAVDNDYWA
jgi:hypothetical protein